MKRLLGHIWLLLVCCGGCHLLLPSSSSLSADASVNQDGPIDAPPLCPFEEDLGAPEPLTLNCHDKWCWEFPTLQANALRDIWGGTVSQSQGVFSFQFLAVGDRGAFLHWNNGWTARILSPDWQLRGVTGTSSGAVYAAGVGASEGLLLDFADPTSTPVPLDTGLTGFTDITVAEFVTGTPMVYAVGTTTTFTPSISRNIAIWQRPADGTGAWTPVTLGPRTGVLNAVASRGDLVVAVGFDLESMSSIVLEKRTESGAWVSGPGDAMLDQELLTVAVVADDLYAVAGREDLGQEFTSPMMQRYQNGLPQGQTVFEKCEKPGHCDRINALVTDGNDAFYAIADRVVFRTEGNAGTLIEPPLSPDSNPGMIAATDGPLGINPVVVGAGGLIRARVADAWRDERGGPIGSVWGGHTIKLTDVRNLSVVAASSGLYASIDEGWAFALTPGLPLGFATWLNGPCDGWVTGFGGVGYITGTSIDAHPDGDPRQLPSRDGGIPDGAATNLREIFDIWGASSDDTWAVGKFGIWHWDGTSWSLVTAFDCGDLKVGASVWGDGPDEVIVVGAKLLDCGGDPSLSGGFVYRCKSTGGASCDLIIDEQDQAFYGVWGEAGSYVIAGTLGQVGGAPMLRKFTVEGGLQSGVIRPVVEPPGLPSQLAAPGLFVALTGISEDEIYAVWVVGGTAILVSWINGNWDYDHGIVNIPLLSIWLTPAKDKLYMGGDHGTIVSKSLP